MSGEFNKYSRNCGEIKGDVSPLYPFFWLGKWGVSWNESRVRRCSHAQGLFVINRSAGKGFYPYVGIIMPLFSCTDGYIKEKLLDITNELKRLLNTAEVDNSILKGNYLKHKANRILNKFPMLDLLQGKFGVDSGFVSVSLSERLYGWVKDSFPMISELTDNDSGLPVEGVKLKNIEWDSVFDYVSWKNSLTNHYDSSISDFTFGVFMDNIVIKEGRARSNEREYCLSKPSNGFLKCFELRSDFKPSTISVRFSQLQGNKEYMHGWIDFIVDIDNKHLTINCSEVFSPFNMLVKWIVAIEEMNIPISITIDEEGSEKVLSAYPSGDADYVYLVIKNPYESDDIEVFTDAVVSRKFFVKEIKEKLRQFIDTEYKSKFWSGSEDRFGTDLNNLTF
ncbi:MAG: hypothetical protein HQK97_08685 [Nitrospirae bacterium]|nr:hypothetical protein [Nitrospirota bacterium]